VTYHPAALLRSQEYKRPAWEDLKRFAAFLAEQGIGHGLGS
jgi:uracil-DNA glycosylase